LGVAEHGGVTMPYADAMTVSSYAERKAAVWRAAQLIACVKGSEEEHEFEMLTQAIVEFDLHEEAQDFIEIPPAFTRFLRGAYGRATAKEG
jgi:hypothetical protein